MNSEAIGAFEAARHAINEAIKAAEQPRTRRLGPNDEARDDGYLNGIKACGCVVMAAIASAPQQAQEALEALDALFRENEIPMSDRNGELYDTIAAIAKGEQSHD